MPPANSVKTVTVGFIEAFKRIPYSLGRPRGNVPYIPQLDGLRALAILFVVVWHSSLRASRLHATNYAFPEHIPHGEIGVVLFFFVSGFVIAQPFLATNNRFAAKSILSFYYRRIRRIFPPYLISIIGCYLVLGPAAYQPIGAPSFYQEGVSLPDSLLASAVFLHGIIYDAAPRLNPPLWSLEIEIQFYLLSPAILFLYLRAKQPPLRQAIGLVVLAATVLLAGLLSGLGHFDGRGRFGLPMHFYLFFLGIFLADLAHRHDWFNRPPHVAFDLLFAAGFALLIQGGFALDPIDGHAVGIPDVLIQTLFCVAIVAMYLGAMRGRVTRLVLGEPWICLIGTMCYSIYLVHGPLMQAETQLVLSRLPLESPWAKWSLAYALLIPSSLIAGAIYYRFIERPFMKSRRSIPLARPNPVPLQQSGN